MLKEECKKYLTDVVERLIEETPENDVEDLKDRFNKAQEIHKFENNYKTLFLPAAGYVLGKNFSERGSGARYWSGTAYSSSNSYRLSFSERKLNVGNIARQNGCSVRPVRLVAED